MLNSILLLTLAILFFAAIFFIGYYLWSYFLNYKPSKKRIEKDLENLKEQLRSWTNKLVPWNEEEMRLLSLNSHETLKKSGGSKVRKGMLYSIYQEPLIAYIRKEYSDGKYALLYAKTSKHEYVYRIMPKGTEIYMDGSAYGRLIDDIELRDPQNKKVLAKLHEKGERLLPVIMNDREIGQIVDQEEKDKVNPRAFEFLQEMEEAQRKRFLAVAIPRIIKRAKVDK